MDGSQDQRLASIETQLGQYARLFEKMSEMVERLVVLEERNHYLDKRTEGTNSAVEKLGEKLDARLREFEEKTESRLGNIYKQLSDLTMKQVKTWAILSFIGAIGAIVLKEIVGKIF